MKLYVCTPTSDEARFKRSGLIWGCLIPLKQYGTVIWELEVALIPSLQQSGLKPSISTIYSKGGWYKQLHNSGHAEFAFDVSCIRSYRKT